MGQRPLTRTLTMLITVAVVLIEPPRLQAQATVDVDNEFPNVGVIIVWLPGDDGQPLELLTIASGSLVHERVMVTAGHFTAPVRDLGGLPPGIGVFASFSPTDAHDQSTWIPVAGPITHPSIPFCPPPDFCDPTTADVFEPLQPGMAESRALRRPSAVMASPRRRLAEPPGPSTWDGKRRDRTSIFEHVVYST